jgi:hypothetical protein
MSSGSSFGSEYPRHLGRNVGRRKAQHARALKPVSPQTPIPSRKEIAHPNPKKQNNNKSRLCAVPIPEKDSHGSSFSEFVRNSKVLPDGSNPAPLFIRSIHGPCRIAAANTGYNKKPSAKCPIKSRVFGVRDK